MFKGGNTRQAGKTDSVAMVESFKTFDLPPILKNKQGKAKIQCDLY